MPDVRDSIARIIQDKALKQSVIAQRAGLTADKFSATLNHRRKLDANEFLKVCAALGMTPEAVAGYQERAAERSCNNGPN